MNNDLNEWATYDENDYQNGFNSFIIVQKGKKSLEFRLSSFLNKKEISFDKFDDDLLIVHIGVKKSFDFDTLVSIIDLFII